MKKHFKMLLKFLITFIFCFALIYIIIFFGGWRLFENRDPILIEIGTALILSLFVFAVNEALTNQEKRIRALEKRFADLEREMQPQDDLPKEKSYKDE